MKVEKVAYKTKGSPFRFEYKNGIYLQINKSTGITMAEIDATNYEGICNFIAELDESLWQARSYINMQYIDLNGKLKGIKKILEDPE